MKKLFLTIILAFVAIASFATEMPIEYIDGHIYTYSYTMDMKKVKILIDTGASKTVVFDYILLQNAKRYNNTVEGLNGKSDAKKKGILAILGIQTVAYYVEADKNYDIILGLDWLKGHNAVIDLVNMKIVYE